MTDHTKYLDLESALIEAVIRLRESLSELDMPPNSFNLSIDADGRVMDGDVKITYRLTDNGYPSTDARGGTMVHVVHEFERRYGWSRRNEPLCLPKVINDE